MYFYRTAVALVAVATFWGISAAHAREKVVLQLRWDHQFQFAGYYAAKWQGYYDQAGFDVEIRSAFGPDGEFRDVTDEVAQGRADFGTAGPDILTAQDRGVPLVIVNSIYQQSPVAFYSMAGGGIRSPGDLIGRRVAVQPGGVATAELQAMLRAESIDPAQVPVQAIKGKLGIEDLATGAADVVAGFTISAEWYANRRNLQLTALRPITYGVDFYGDALFARRDKVENNPDLVERFAAATLRGWEYAMAHRQEIADRISRDLPRHIPVRDFAGFNNFQASEVGRLVQYPAVQLGHTNPLRWQKMHDALREAGLVTGNFDADRSIFNPARLREMSFERRVNAFGAIVAVLLAVAATVWLVTLRRNMSARRRMQMDLEQQKAFLESLVNNLPALISMTDAEGRVLFVNDLVCEVSGMSRDQILGQKAVEIFGIAADSEFALHQQTAMRTGNPIIGIEKPSELRKDRTVTTSFVPIKGADGVPARMLTIAVDVTELQERELQLRQAQKMEAVGQLTGGVAHDFNNLLTIILGNLELVQDEAGSKSLIAKYADNALSAAQRGAELTHRLLAFSRKQALVPMNIDARELIDGLLQLMRRTLGETIEIDVVGDRDLWRCEVDAAQLESAILNLAINARDAMPDGGKLTISVRNVCLDDDYAAAQADVAVGRYVLVSVTDTGVGIPNGEIAHVFEPFFTTKEVGKGSGLGLSMVYGFVKQSGGQVTIYSEVGIGTTVNMYLPKSETGVDAATKHVAESEPRALGETVLLVEDDPDVRQLVVALLRELGYQIIEARSASAALEILDTGERFDLLLTDVVLPGGMSGPELAEIITQRLPGLAVLFMSGYSDDAIIHQGRLDKGVELLNKPFRKADLARKIRTVLDRSLCH